MANDECVRWSWRVPSPVGLLLPGARFPCQTDMVPEVPMDAREELMDIDDIR